DAGLEEASPVGDLEGAQRIARKHEERLRELLVVALELLWVLVLLFHDGLEQCLLAAVEDLVRRLSELLGEFSGLAGAQVRERLEELARVVRLVHLADLVVLLAAVERLDAGALDPLVDGQALAALRGLVAEDLE